MVSRLCAVGVLAVLAFVWCASVGTGPAWSASHAQASGPSVVLGPEVVSLRTEHSRTYRLADGSFQAQISAAPLNFRDGSGRWTPIDNRFEQGSDGGLRNAAGPAAIDVPASAAGWVRLARDGRSVAFSLIGGSSSGVRAHGDEASFAVALPGVTTSYRAEGGNLKETLSLASAAVPDRYAFALNAPGLHASINRAGGVVFVDSSGKTRFGFAAPWMQDASGALSRSARYEIRTQGGQQQVVLVLDRRWLTDPARQFPVTVDPTVYTDIWGVCELKNGADADVSTCTDGSDPVWVGNDGREIHRASFGIDPASAGVPANALVTDAELTGWFDSQSVSEASDIDLYAGADTLGTPYETWNSYDGTNAWTTPGGDMRPQRESRRELQPDWTGWWVSFGMLNLAQQRIRVCPMKCVWSW